MHGFQTPYAKSFTPNPLDLYRWDILLSGSLYPLLHVIEVGLRNAIYEAVADRYRDKDWLMDSPFLDPIEQKEIQKQAHALRQIGKLDPGHLIAELSFGFWCSLLDRRYEHQQLFWPTLLRAVFPGLKSRKIHLIRKRFNRIRRLRNRIYHYEPIWHWKDLPQQHQDIVEAIKWIEPELLALVDVEKFPEVYFNRPNRLSTNHGQA